MNKIVASPEQAVADITDGATVAIAGFGVGHRFATSLRWEANRFVLDEVAPGFTAQEVIALTEMDVAVGPNVRTME